MSARMEANAPVKKVTAGALAAALTTVLVFVLNSFALPENKQLTPEIAAALTTAFSSLAAYVTPPGRNERVVEADVREESKVKAASA